MAPFALHIFNEKDFTLKTYADINALLEDSKTILTAIIICQKKISIVKQSIMKLIV